MGRITKIFGEYDENTFEQLSAVAENAEYMALMADNHLGYVMPIGGVAAYDNKVSPVGVGFDIGCGNCAIKTNLTLDDMTDTSWNEIADEVASTFSFGIGKTNKNRDAPVGHGMFDSSDWDAIPNNMRDVLKQKAINQLGTIGGGGTIASRLW